MWKGKQKSWYCTLFVTMFLFLNERCKMLPYDVYTRPNTDKFKDLLCTDDYITLVKLARFCKIILSVIN
jgi:hypothetical protein